jgi:hypothetical protein
LLERKLEISLNQAGISTTESTTKTSADDFAVQVRNQIQAGKNRRDDSFLASFYQSKITSFGTSALDQQQFTSVLEELGIHLKDEEIEILFRSMDANNDGVMNLEEFKRAVQSPSTIEQLIYTLPISQIFADAMPDMKGTDRLRLFGQLTPEQIDGIIQAAIPYLKSTFEDAVDKVKISEEAKEKSKINQITGKFEVPPEMSAGTVEDFHGGLPARIGMPVRNKTTHCVLCVHFIAVCMIDCITPKTIFLKLRVLPVLTLR